MKLKIKGQEVEVTQAVIDTLEAELAAATVNLKTANDARDVAIRELSEGTSDAALDKIVTEREAKAAKAAELVAKRARAATAYPTLVNDETSEASILAYCATLDAAAAEDPDGQKRLAGLVGPRKAAVIDAAEARPRTSKRQAMLNANQNAYKVVGEG